MALCYALSVIKGHFVSLCFLMLVSVSIGSIIEAFQIRKFSQSGSSTVVAPDNKGDATVPDLESWTQWRASEAPHDIQNVDVRIEGAYLSNYTLTLVSTPVSAWNRMPDTVLWISSFRIIC